MQPTALSSVALLALLPAAAFGDLDCITVETCAKDQRSILAPSKARQC